MLQILSVAILEKTPVFDLFAELNRRNADEQNRNQLSLFDF